MFDIIIGHLNVDRYREKNLRYTIDYYTKHCPFANIIVVEQKTKTDLSMYSNVKHIAVDGFEYYSRSFGFNEGMKYSKKELNLLVDNDCILDPIVIENIEDFLVGEVFLPYNSCIDLDEITTNTFIDTGKITSRGTVRLGHNRCYGGAMFISKRAFDYVGGYEHLVGWGCEDNIFCIKCDRLIGITRIEGEWGMFHLWHPKAYDENYIKSQLYRNNYELMLKIQSMDKNQILEYISRHG